MHHYNYHRIVQSLRTRRNGVAKSRSTLLASQLDSYWAQLRLANADIPGKSILSNTNDLSKTAIDSTESISIEAALKIYLKQKNAGKGKTFKAAAERACRYLSDVAGSKSLHEYSRSDALTFRNALIERGLAGSSVARVFNTVSAIFNFTSNELALELRNPFRGVYFDKAAGVSKRLPIPTSTIQTIQKSCKEHDDDCRWLVALISDSGLRLSEAAGLTLADINITDDVPHLLVRPNTFRNLKTAGSERTIPLVGMSQWAARRLINGNLNETNSAAFPRYTKLGIVNANSASASLNKWLKQYVTEGCTMHSFRHSLRDRLRAAECPSDMIDQVGGWAHGSVGKNYGTGYSLKKLQKYLNRIVIQ